MAKSATKKKPVKATKGDPKLGRLPEWDLKDLYPGIDSPELKRDLETAETQSAAFEKAYKGKLAELAAVHGAPGLLEAVKQYEKLGDVLGRIGSCSRMVLRIASRPEATNSRASNGVLPASNS